MSLTVSDTSTSPPVALAITRAAQGAVSLDNLAHVHPCACTQAELVGSCLDPLGCSDGVDRSFEDRHELVAASGILYTVGAVVYARRRPDPHPQVFGYHELFHLLTVAAVACEYVVVAFYVLPRA